MNSEGSDFKQIRLIGRGSYSKVIEARNIKTNKIVAIKILKKDNLPENYTVKKIDEEISLHHSLKHTNIVTLFGYFTVNSNIHLIMEYCHGGDVYNDIIIYGTYNHQRTATYMYQMCSSLKYLNQFQIIHRDIKSENVLISKSGAIKLCDFTCATNASSSRTTFCGTIKFMAPEIREGHLQSQSVDVWSLGLFLREMYSGVLESDYVESMMNVDYSESESYDDIEKKINAELMKPDGHFYYENLLFHLLRISVFERLSISQIMRHPYIKANSENHLDRCDAAIEQWKQKKLNKKINVTYECDAPVVLEDAVLENIKISPESMKTQQARKFNVTWNDQ